MMVVFVPDLVITLHSYAMFIPLRTDRRTSRRPIVTELLIIINSIVYLSGLVGEYFNFFEDRAALSVLGWLDPSHFKAWQLVTYQFLHDPHGYLHIIFNMLFLWVFGAAVEDRLGRWWFLLFYLLGGAFAGLAHMWTSNAPVIGASGAVAAVSGAFLALFPRTKIQVLVFFIFIGVYAIPAMWFLAIYFAIDLLRASGEFFGGGKSNVAFMAHIGGYLYGFGVAFTLLATGVLKRTEFDAFYLIRQSRRRAEFKRAQQDSKGVMWEAPATKTPDAVPAAVQADQPMSPENEQRLRQRSAIQRMIEEHHLDNAASAYVKLLEDFPDEVLSERHQTDIANTLYAEDRYSEAARAYELLLGRYPRSREADSIKLILGMTLARHLNQPQRALELIQAARTGLSSASQRDLADQLLAELNT